MKVLQKDRGRYALNGGFDRARPAKKWEKTKDETSEAQEEFANGL